LNNVQENATVKIINNTGKAVYNAEYADSKLEIDVSNFDTGIYFVTVKAGDFITTGKLQIIK